MSDLFRKYADLKKKVGGNRELMGYEETFGMPREEQQHITPPARYLVRILGRLPLSVSERLASENILPELISTSPAFWRICSFPSKTTRNPIN